MQKEKAKKRNDNDPPEAIAEWGWQYHHMGIPTKEKMPNERYLPHLKMYGGIRDGACNYVITIY